MSMHLSLTCKFLRQVGFALARTCRHLTPPELNAAVHGVCAGPDGCARGEPGALRICRLRVPDPGECGGGPDQPAEQGLGVGGPYCPSPSFLPALHTLVSKLEASPPTAGHVWFTEVLRSL